eukprot:CAMPEP_0113520464 /NCGR_PEP_ID=MMETSP0014_2-20120614/44098_1 /TAXON_ID=2857 /ORGANISM="Nitzschia sp." /LENGTH=957 /DNA_ID=CAMNT_0000418313 /DNA_START=179 /DNA_END=3052 /DNA_ORIENTATION=+ /assembly_acc=CAM_ASM_000159
MASSFDESYPGDEESRADINNNTAAGGGGAVCGNIAGVVCPTSTTGGSKSKNNNDASALCNTWNNPCATNANGGGDTDGDTDADGDDTAPRATLKFKNPRPDLDDDASTVSPLPSPTPGYGTGTTLKSPASPVPFDQAESFAQGRSYNNYGQVLAHERCDSPNTMDETDIFDGLDEDKSMNSGARSAGADAGVSGVESPPQHQHQHQHQHQTNNNNGQRPPGIMEWKAYNPSDDEEEDDDGDVEAQKNKGEDPAAGNANKDGSHSVITSAVDVASTRSGGRSLPSQQGVEMQPMDSHLVRDLEDIELDEQEADEDVAEEEEEDDRYVSRKYGIISWTAGGLLKGLGKRRPKDDAKPVEAQNNHDDGNDVSLYSYDDEQTIESDNRHGGLASAGDAVNTSKETSASTVDLQSNKGTGDLPEAVIQQNVDVEDGAEDNSKTKNQGRSSPPSTSWWAWLSEEEFIGVSYRWWLCFLILLFLLIVLVVVTVQFNNNTNESDSESPVVPTASPTMATMVPTNAPTTAPTLDISACQGVVQADGVMLRPGDVLAPGESRCSPDQQYLISLTNDGDFVLNEALTNVTVWSAGVTSGTRLALYDITSTENSVRLVVEDEAGDFLWEARATPIFASTQDDDETTQSSGTVLTLDDVGVLSLQQTLASSTVPATLWLEGVPQGLYNGPPASDLETPVRGTFYFADYDTTFESWQVNGGLQAFEPDSGWYSSSDPSIIEKHVDTLKYGNISLGVIPWDGAGLAAERARITSLQSETERQQADLKWTTYYMKARAQPSIDEIQSDLDYLKTHYAWHPSWAHMQGLPVIFINNNAGGCDTVQQYVDAADEGWFLVFRVFDGFDLCETNEFVTWSDHTGSTADGVDNLEGFYSNVSPGAWRAGDDAPTMPRLSGEQWCQNVQDMVDSGAPLQMVITFNDWRRGTMVEGSETWRSDSGYGIFMDCLNDPASF